MQNLKTTLQNLNPQQKTAVNTTEWPVMVIAWPWTWKTQILAWRIANILEKWLAESQNILCMTYTDAGVVAMRKRLLEFIWTEAYNVNIHTFHSFCNEVIQENLDYFQKRELKLVSDLDRKIIIEKIIWNLKPENPLYKKPWMDLSFEISRLENLFSVMKSEDWSAKDIQKAIDEYIADLPNRDKFVYKKKYKDKKPWDFTAKYFAELEKMKMVSAWAELFDEYKKILEKNNSFDYQDMILWVIKAFQENEWILARYQEKFQYILVDEFQDTNGSQNEIVSLLSDFWEDPNIFVVWDDDQSIFKFQGANVKNILEFYEKYENSIAKIILEKNYRSSQEILDIAKSSIEFNQERISNKIWIEKNFYAENEKVKNLKWNVKIVEYFNDIHEEIWIVRKIEELQKKWEKLSEIAVIYRKHSQVENIKKILEAKKIPLNIKQKINILDEIFIKNIIKILDYIYWEFKNPYSKEDLLFEILHFDFFWIKISEIAKISLQINENKKKWEWKKFFRDFFDEEFFLENEKKFLEWKENFSWSEEIILEQEKKFLEKKKFFELWKKILQAIENVSNKPLLQQIEFIISEFWILEKVMKSEEKSYLMRLLTSFFNFIKEENQKNPLIWIWEILENLKKMQKYWVQLPISKINFSQNWVIFTTAHSSKWLEFKYVFLIWLEDKKWEKARKMTTNFFLPDTLTMSNEWSEEEELRRLFFVAITRAKEFLQISFSWKWLDEKEKIPSKFLAEVIQQNPNLEIKKEVLDEEIVQNYYSLIFQAINSNFWVIEKDEIDKVLENFSLSVSSLNTYLRCPVQFYFEKILKVPSSENSQMAFWNAVHYALEYYLKNWKSNWKFWDFAVLKNFFEKWMFIKKNVFTKDEYKKLLEYWEKVLKDFFEIKKFDLKSSAEKNIFTNLWDIKITWKIDRIDFSEDWDVSVVDYKTWKFKKQKFESAKEDFEIWNFEKDAIKKIWWDYWRQAVFYKILFDKDVYSKFNVKKISFEYVEDTENPEKILEIWVDDVEKVEKQTKEVWKKIKNHEFYVWCEDEKCFWCNFKNNLEKNL